MKAVFRVDASSHMGSGHFVRCLTLAETLRERGAEVRFVCREHPGHMAERLTRSSIPVTLLPAPPGEKTYTENYADWLGVSQETDAAETIEALRGDRPDWLVVDHYGLDASWERALRPHVGKVLVIDDLANRPHDCDALLDQNFSQDAETRYQGRVPPDCRRLLGPRYALLRLEYLAYRKTRLPRNGKVQRILVFFGGTDPVNMTGMALQALSHSDFQNCQADVVIGAHHPHRPEIERLVAQRPQTVLHEPRPHLADLMAEADLALGGGGATTWERLCLGLPSLVVGIAQNQVPACESLAQSGLIRYLGFYREIDHERLRHELLSMMGNTQTLTEISSKAQNLVDGLGALRVAEFMNPTPIECLRLLPAQQADAAIYFDWVNEPEVRRQSLNSELITWKSHQAWFQSRLADPDSRLYMLYAGILPVGQIRFDMEGAEACIDYSLDPVVRGRHWASKLVTMGAHMLQNSLPVLIRADVKEGNQASCAVFTRLGFESSPTPPPREMRVFISPLSRIVAVGSTNSFPNSSTAGSKLGTGCFGRMA